MDLVQEPVLSLRQQYTCPMHPEIIQEEPAQLYGMDLVPMKLTESEDNKIYLDLRDEKENSHSLHCLFSSLPCLI
jgi:Cu2+-exporting ATPase